MADGRACHTKENLESHRRRAFELMLENVTSIFRHALFYKPIYKAHHA